jgi:PKD repeat protein
MRSIRLLAVATTVLVLGSACGGDDPPTGNENDPPVALFTAPTCTVNAPCAFTSSSTDDVGVTGWNWDVNADNTPDYTTATVNHTFTVAGSPTVRLIVTDVEGLADTVSQPVTVNPVVVPGNLPPTATFTAPTNCTVNSACPFSGDASTDSDGTITAYEWDFGDDTEVDNNANTNHTFTAPGTYQVQLTVTDDDGVTNSVTHPVSIAGPSATQCTTISTSEVDCALGIVSRSTITISLTSADCELGGNLVLIPPPGADTAQNVFNNVCDQPTQAPRTLSTEAGTPLVFDAGGTLHVRLKRGTGTPEPGSPAGTITGTAPTWTLNFDDGGNPGGDGEPDFGDVVVTVQATPAP